jgi:hypothetical protein
MVLVFSVTVGIAEPSSVQVFGHIFIERIWPTAGVSDAQRPRSGAAGTPCWY